MSLAFFSAASLIIAVPSAVGVFAWIATIWTGKPILTTAFLFFASFIVLFYHWRRVRLHAGLPLPVDWQLTDTYFVVAHLHYVLVGINLFPVIGATYFWFPKMTGRLMDERLGRWNFWTMFVGFNLGFFPMHISGLLGMPRRVYTFADGMGWNTLNLVTTIGSFLFAAGILIFLVNVINSSRRGKPAGDNPWDAPTLEWATSSPPPPYNFAVIPIVASRHPLWEDRLNEPGQTAHEATSMSMPDWCWTTARKRSARERSTPNPTSSSKCRAIRLPRSSLPLPRRRCSPASLSISGGWRE